MRAIIIVFALALAGCSKTGSQQKFTNVQPIPPAPEGFKPVPPPPPGLPPLPSGYVLDAPPVGSFKLFPTKNIWTQLKLDTRDGRIWQVSIAVKDNLPSEQIIQPTPQTKQPYIGRFTLEPTQNMWNFIMLDTSDGRTWQIQWGTNPLAFPITNPQP